MAQDVDIIKTQRLFLRGINEDDAAQIVKWRSDPEVYQYFKSAHKITIEEHLAWFNNNYKQNGNRFDWMCIEQISEKRIGVFGLVKKHNQSEINYILAPYAQHKGYATEAINALIEYANSVWGIKAITAEIHHDNLPSVALVERLGFMQASSDGEFDTYILERED